MKYDVSKVNAAAFNIDIFILFIWGTINNDTASKCLDTNV